MSDIPNTDEHCGSFPPTAVGKTAASSVSCAEDVAVDGPAIVTVRERRSCALRSIGLNPEDFCDCILTDTDCVCQAMEQPAGEAEIYPSSKSVPPTSDEAWQAISDVFPPRHANQIITWRETFDLLSLLANTGIAWVRLGKHSEAARARLLRSQPSIWSEIEKRIIAVDIADDERVRLQRTVTFAQRYIAQRATRASTAPTPTAAVRLR